MRSEHEVYHQLREYELDTLYCMEIFLYCCPVVSDIRDGLENSPTVLAFNALVGSYMVTRNVQRRVLDHSPKEMP